MATTIAGVYTSTISARAVKEFIAQSVESGEPVELSVIHQRTGNEEVMPVTFAETLTVDSLGVFKDIAHGLNQHGKEVVVLLGSAEEEEIKRPTILVAK